MYLYICHQRLFNKRIIAKVLNIFLLLYKRAYCIGSQYCPPLDKTQLLTLSLMAEFPVENLDYRQPPFANCGVVIEFLVRNDSTKEETKKIFQSYKQKLELNYI